MSCRPEDNAQITPVISESSANFIEGLVKDAEAKGATFCTGPYRREGNLIWPVVLDNVTPDMRIAWEEVRWGGRGVGRRLCMF
jgi:glyceraldehyde-3-phosphate dehydrogenase (NADP+)